MFSGITNLAYLISGSMSQYDQYTGLFANLPQTFSGLVAIDVDDIPVVTVDDSAKETKTVLQFKSRSKIPRYIDAFVYKDANADEWMIINSYPDQGSLEVSKSSSKPDDDPVTYSYKFSTHMTPCKIN